MRIIDADAACELCGAKEIGACSDECVLFMNNVPTLSLDSLFKTENTPPENIEDPLIKLLYEAKQAYQQYLIDKAKKALDTQTKISAFDAIAVRPEESFIADYLISHNAVIKHWISVEDELPNVNKNATNTEQVGVIVRIKGSTKSAYRIYQRTVIRGETVFRWKYPFDRISDEEITH